LKNISYP